MKFRISIFPRANYHGCCRWPMGANGPSAKNHIIRRTTLICSSYKFTIYSLGIHWYTQNITSTSHTSATRPKTVNMSTPQFKHGSQRQHAPADSLSTPQMVPKSEEISKLGTAAPEMQSPTTHTPNYASPTQKTTHDIIYKVMSHFKLYCTRPARSLLFYTDEHRRKDIQTTISLIRSRLQTAEEECLFHQLMYRLTLELPWLAAAEDKQREQLADRESLAALESGWAKYESQQVNRDWQERRAKMEQAERLVGGVRRILEIGKKKRIRLQKERSEKAERHLARLNADTNYAEGEYGGTVIVRDFA